MRLLLAASFAALATGAFAQSSFVYSGDTTNKARFLRPDTISSPTLTGTRSRYEATSFTVDATGTYIGELSAAFDPYLLVYQDSFDPANPQANLLNGDRRYAGDFTILSGTAPGTPVRAARIFASEAADSNNEQFVRGAGLQLQAGRTYVSVVTAFYDADSAVQQFGIPVQGAYTVGIGGGPGNVRAIAAVPEPATMAALGLGAAALLRRRRRQG